MKNYVPVISILLILLVVYTALNLSSPKRPDRIQQEYGFSTENAMEHIKQISRFPHAVGFEGHRLVREYLLAELKVLGLQPQIQEGYTAGDWANFCKATNIMARIEGSGKGKALLLLSHYDSSPHSSLGASDDASGVATILEGLRAFLKQGTMPENDIIVLFTDAEELGLNGADLFVNEHPWAADVGLVLNFEARGSGGPSIMLIETNRGNSKLIEAFLAAKTAYPVANSLAYSIYKMLPNDTDLTVFREDRDIEGLNFAFIDDHFDYHTALDRFDRLDVNTVAHQGSYLMPLLHHFSKENLGDLKSLNDSIYFNIPFFKLLAYPFDWILPMYFLALSLFIILLVYGVRKGVLRWKGMGKGLGIALIILAVNGAIGYLIWPLLLKIYPRYAEILQGFTYNGHTYILAMVFLSLAVCFWGYQSLRKEAIANLLIGPLLIWLLICWLLACYLPGASFFILPVFALLAALLVTINQESPNPFVLIMLAVPAIWILAPPVELFPVALGLKMLITTTLLTSFIFLLTLPVFANLKGRWGLGGLCFILFLGFMTGAHFQSGFDAEKPLPTSLLYVLDADTQSAKWVTYDGQLSAWNSQFIDPETTSGGPTDKLTLSSKYGSGFTFSAEAPLKAIDGPQVVTTKDTIVGTERQLTVEIIPQRNVNRLEIFTGDTPLKKVAINDIELSAGYLEQRRNNRLLTHYISDNIKTVLEISIPSGQAMVLELYEASNDLLDHPLFSVPARPEDQIPKPFVLNDAILVKKTIRFE